MKFNNEIKIVKNGRFGGYCTTGINIKQGGSNNKFWLQNKRWNFIGRCKRY